MSTRSSSILVIASAIALASSAGCRTYESQHHTSADVSSIRWVYYPEVDVYYSPSHELYWTLVPAENRWVQSRALPPQTALRGPSVEVADRSATPFHAHHEHVAEYRRAIAQPPAQPGQ